MLLYHSVILLIWPDLLGFRFFLMKTQNPFGVICCNALIHPQSDLDLLQGKGSSLGAADDIRSIWEKLKPGLSDFIG
ncbi:hypothetical protein SLE2022_151790 [Rubroshorea leprosula]